MINTDRLKMYGYLRDRIVTGSIVLFSGNGPVSNLIKVGQGMAGHGHATAMWTHVGIAYRDPITGALLLLESTSLSAGEDILTGTIRSGVQLVSMSTRVAEYDGLVAVRIPTHGPSDEQVLAMAAKMNEFRGRPYEQSKKDLVDAVFDRFGQGDDIEDLSSLFCSELVAEILQAMRWIDEYQTDEAPTKRFQYIWPLCAWRHPDVRPSDEWVPADFASSGLMLRGRTLAMPISLMVSGSPTI